MKSYFLFLFLFVQAFSFKAQETEKTNTLSTQFDEIYRTSTSYQKYKVINKVRFQKLKKDVLDSLTLAKEAILEKENQLSIRQNTIDNLNKKNDKVELKLNSSIKKENTVSLFGMELKKDTYHTSLWIVVVFLFLGLLYFIYKFSNSNALTKEAKSNLLDVEEEFEQHRKRALEKEQKLRRQLQDEINKQRNA